MSKGMSDYFSISSQEVAPGRFGYVLTDDIEN